MSKISDEDIKAANVITRGAAEKLCAYADGRGVDRDLFIAKALDRVTEYAKRNSFKKWEIKKGVNAE